jgi:hypothetical protein
MSEVEVFPAFNPGRTPAPPQGKKYQALYDTGATHSAITPQVVTDLQLPIIGARTVGVGGGALACAPWHPDAETLTSPNQESTGTPIVTLNC